jgi:hypothetical protein
MCMYKYFFDSYQMSHNFYSNNVFFRLLVSFLVELLGEFWKWKNIKQFYIQKKVTSPKNVSLACVFNFTTLLYSFGTFVIIFFLFMTNITLQCKYFILKKLWTKYKQNKMFNRYLPIVFIRQIFNNMMFNNKFILNENFITNFVFISIPNVFCKKIKIKRLNWCLELARVFITLFRKFELYIPRPKYILLYKSNHHHHYIVYARLFFLFSIYFVIFF